jgi:predicted nucleotidyltransferase
MPFGLSTATTEKVRKVLAEHPQVEQAILYGSRALGTYKNGSDIDLTLVGGQLDLSLLLKIENELDDLLLPYKIDLSLYDQIDNEELKEHIRRAGQVFYHRQGG